MEEDINNDKIFFVLIYFILNFSYNKILLLKNYFSLIKYELNFKNKIFKKSQNILCYIRK